MTKRWWSSVPSLETWPDTSFNVGTSTRFARRASLLLLNDVLLLLKCEKFLNNDSYPFLLPKSYDDVDDLNVRNWKKFLEGTPFRVNAQVSDFAQRDEWTTNVFLQCVRSVGPWSAGTKIIESSIQNAYVQMIDAAQHYIYIEVRQAREK